MEVEKEVQGIGRPTKYRSEFCEYLKKHLAKGLSYEIFGACLPDYGAEYTVSKQTLYDWEKIHSDFVDAKKEGWDLSQMFWEKEGISGMWGNKAFNSTVWIFNMKNRFGWRDKKEVTHEGDVGLKLAYNLNDSDSN